MKVNLQHTASSCYRRQQRPSRAMIVLVEDLTCCPVARVPRKLLGQFFGPTIREASESPYQMSPHRGHGVRGLLGPLPGGSSMQNSMLIPILPSHTLTQVPGPLAPWFRMWLLSVHDQDLSFTAWQTCHLRPPFALCCHALPVCWLHFRYDIVWLLGRSH